jgi:hypothetical protein
MALYDQRRFSLVMLTMGLTLAGSAVSAVIRGGWVSATVLNVAVDLLILGYIIRNRDGLLGRLLLMGFVAGLVELLTADPWAVRSGTLVYEAAGPFINYSPLYMPLGWAYVLMQIGYIAWWVLQSRGLGPAIVATTILGGTMIPVYEALAKSANWWIYQNVPMIFGAPYYVILGEALIGMALPFIVRPVAARGLAWSVVLGIALGCWTWVSAIVAYRLVG